MEISEAVTVELGTVAEAMNRAVVTLDRRTPAGEAARALDRAGVAGAPVVEGRRVVGLVSQRDLLARARKVTERAQVSGPFLRYDHVLDHSFPELTVGEAMTPQVVVAREDWPLGRAALVMDEARVNRLPVVDHSGALVGILARDDVISRLAAWARAAGHRVSATAPS